ncbi:16S rRNA (uracil(1498)-N(3))-methyltransferase [Corynebacterium uterequi]|uniref:Ribosomal RNA small subunit methyltransferase E n=1 Tax=Corynebacterium uterequi TaxID=1072256 RepID=A0A0G3HE36_9CORY|nr:16S rRNA (uracil(1498)-N(3))-methyltransferase [Corynebacterium uterequi]AKK11579.1 RNA methyltransferase, RsmE family [Corynebacterium uterequi]
MSLPVFIADDLSAETVALSGSEGRHAVTVKRIGVGERIKLVDGRGGWVSGEVVAVEGKDTLAVRVDARGEDPQPRPRVTVIQAIPKSERAELAVDLATQGGADAIIAWQSQRTIAKWGAKADKQLGKWRDAAAAAAKQSRRSRIPDVSGPLTTKQVAQLIATRPAYVLHEDAERSMKDVDLDVDELFVLVGPEGGIGDEELALLGATPIVLGPQVYRTASAALVALSAIGTLTSRW